MRNAPRIRREPAQGSARDNHLWVSFRITEEQFNAMLERQGGRCAVPACGKTKPGGKGAWHVDHDHGCCPGRRSCGKCVRALLCYNCNIGLGQFNDDARRLRGAIEYLEGFA